MTVAPGVTLPSMPVLDGVDETLHRLSVGDYYRLFETGILTDEDRVELLDGLVIEMSPESPMHQRAWVMMNRHLARGLPDHQRVRGMGPIEVQPDSVPEPDLAVVDFTAMAGDAHPESAHLVVEVSKTSLRKDLGRKAGIYARAGVREYWVVDVTRLIVFVHLEPRGDRYALIREYRPPESLQATHIDVPPVSLAELFGSEPAGAGPLTDI